MILSRGHVANREEFLPMRRGKDVNFARQFAAI